MKYLIGIDIGTHSLRTCLFNINGEIIDKYDKNFPTNITNRNWIEQNPNDWIVALEETIIKLVKNNNNIVENIKAISYGCTSCTVVTLDENGEALRPAIMWLDERAWKQAEEITKTNHPVLKYSGNKESPQWMLPKVMWLKKMEPLIYKKAKYIIEQTDFITHKLTGEYTISKSNAAAKWHYTSLDGGFPNDLFKKLDIEEIVDKWPNRVLSVGEPISKIENKFSKKTGLNPNTLVVQGGVDSHAGMVGVGAINDGNLALVIGTSSCHMAQSSKPIYADVWGPYQEAIEKKYYTIGGGQSTTGSIIDWLKQKIFSDKISYEEIDKKIAKIPAGSEGLVALDYFQGNRTPYKDPFARGSIIGLSLKHKKEHIYRAFYEAVAYGTRLIIENLENNNYLVNDIFATGGGAKSKLWMQIHSDVSSKPIYLSKTDEATALGAAIWAGLGSNIFDNYNDAINSMVYYKEKIEPNLINTSIYDFYYNMYKTLYKNSKRLMHEIVNYENKKNEEDA